MAWPAGARAANLCVLNALYLEHWTNVIKIRSKFKHANVAENINKRPPHWTNALRIMAAQLVRPQAAVKIEEPLEPFLQEAGDIAFEFLSLRLQPTDAAVGTKAPHPAVKDAKGEPGLLRADDEFPESAEPTPSELPDSLPMIGDGGRRQAQGGVSASSSGPPPPPTQSRLVRRGGEREGERGERGGG